MRAPRDRLRGILRVARWEVTHTAETLDRRTLVLGVAALAVAGAVFAASAAVGVGGVALDANIYRVGVPPDSPYRDAVAATPSLVAHPPDAAALERGNIDVLVVDDDPDDAEIRVRAAETPKGRAALAAFRAAVESYNDQLMAVESNRSAAFPVIVSLRYVDRSRSAGTAVEGAVGGSDADGSADASDTGAFGDGPRSSAGAEDAVRGDGYVSEGPFPLPNVGGTAFGGRSTGSPADIQPPFPFGSLVLAFLFLVPLNFVAQSYGGTVLSERLNRRGELLLATPLTASDIVAGKTLPYLLGALTLVGAVALFTGGGLTSVAAVVPVALLYLALTFVGAMFARSFKELTFVTVAVSVFLTTYTFVPAIFTDVTPIALISPLTLVVRDLQGATVSAGAYAFSTGPFYVTSGVLFLLGVGVYRPEDMFTQKPVAAKFLDAVSARVGGGPSVALLSALAIPFAFMAELLALAVLFILPVDVAVPVLFVAIAVVEEVAKSIHVYAGFSRGRLRRTLSTSLGLGAASGIGFFLGEKLTVVVHVVGLPSLALGHAAFAPSGFGVSTVALLVAPLLLHVITASASAVGASRGKRWYAAALLSAVGGHIAYNLAVVRTLV